MTVKGFNPSAPILSADVAMPARPVEKELAFTAV